MTSITLHSSVHGPADAPVLLLLNSLGATEAMWADQLPLLASHYRVITCDTRGHGNSPAPEGPYQFSDFVADAIGVLDAHGVEKATVMGLSLGGMTALGLGLNHPDRIERIVCCAARSDAPEPFVQSWHTRLAKLDDGGIEAVWDGTVDFWLSDETRESQPDREAALRESFLRTSETGYRGCAHALMQLDYLRHLNTMTIPALFVSGENDAGATPATMEAMAAACPGSQYACVSGAKHVINVDRPQEFALAIGGFLGLDTE